ncbi:MAG: formate/nitrite transporter family protein [Erysipelotrichaceae bacterium]|nr:formate/nitrite transporter family protein [Erysipelotrichaceae bacterium]
MKKYLDIFLSAILSGVCISLGVCVYLSLIATAKIIGSLFFGLGLFIIIHFKLHLYTGKVGDVLNHSPKYLFDLLICIIGNFVGVLATTSIMKLTRLNPTLVQEAFKIVETKQADSWYSILILSTLCGVMIYIACKGHEKCEYPLGKVIFCFLAISIFILCGFEHCIANAAYYTLAGIFNLKAFGYFLLMILGNAIGAIFVDGAFKIIEHLRTPKEAE